MKIGFTILGAIFDLICIYKVQAIFWKCLKWLKWVLLRLNYAYTACYTEETHVRLTGGAMGPPVIHTGEQAVSPVANLAGGGSNLVGECTYVLRATWRIEWGTSH